MGAHPDDVELGCGGTLAFFKNMGHEVYALVLTRGEASGSPEQREKECKDASKMIGIDRLFLRNLPDTRITDGIETIRVIEQVIDEVAPDIVFSHSEKDTHQDHRATHHASLSAARRTKRILLYESPAAMKDFSPQVFVDIESTMDRKMRAVSAFDSQSSKPYVNGPLSPVDPCRNCASYGSVSNAIAGLARFRGFQAGLGLAEAFEVAKFVLDIEANPGDQDPSNSPVLTPSPTHSLRGT